MELRVLLGRHFLHAEEGVQHAQDEDGSAAVEAPDDAVRHHALGGGVGNAYPGEEDGEQVAQQGTGVAQEALDAVGGGFLALVYHVSHHHFEGLHGNVDGGIQENEREQAEPHGHVQAQEQPGAELQAAGVGQEQHYQDGNDRAYQQVGFTATHPAPGSVGILADERLDNHSHQRGKNPEETELVRIGAQRGKDTADIGALQGIGNLHPQETKAQIHQLAEG